MIKTITKSRRNVTKLRDDDGFLHSSDGPAVYDKEGNFSVYYDHGVIHRIDGPAYIDHNNRQKINRWYKNGKLHREDGPAVELYYKTCSGFDGYEKIYYLNGVQTRTDGPSRILFDPQTEQSKCICYEWTQDNQLSRTPSEGPAQYIMEGENILLRNYFYKGFELYDVYSKKASLKTQFLNMLILMKCSVYSYLKG